MVLAVGEGLRGGDNDALAGMDAQRVEVLHVADGDAVVVTVAHHLILDLFPPLERLLDEELVGIVESLGGEGTQLLLVVAEAGAQSPEGVGGTYDDGVVERAGSRQRLFHGGGGKALYALHPYLVQLLHEEVAVFSVHDRLYRCAQHGYVVFLEDSRLV